ncbi:50S ribosomal protein L1 [Candidatus Berkiella aquae]|uniref:Large ribosomal subunit protein uL1 n=1 Tax=Candidatus Berkiella aquae TaxID=295108 RepID=A0A0Q9YBP6_9GAMM|nr:50S ribosomal protein L1 [Candidatus Berkiella aquae]MCS5710255.1 50S ribosomal protein L1 [Candidatus Berkiella aquae]
MAKLSKRMSAIAEKVTANKVYALDDALTILKQLSSVKFVESMDVAVMLGIDPKKSDQVVRGATLLPNGTGRDMRVAVFAQGANAQAAKDAGAEFVGFEDLADQIKQMADTGKWEFDVLIATPDAMRLVGQLGRVLGPRGLMPNPKVGTVTTDVAKAVKNAKAGQVSFRSDKGGIVHCTIGKVNFEVKALRENLEKLVMDLRRAKPSTSKGVYMRRITLTTTMGPGLIIDQGSLSI